jgi:hypothetical protein
VSEKSPVPNSTRERTEAVGFQNILSALRRGVMPDLG